ncbi:MAG: hypothetical protein R6V67_09465 [Spirochaetia bacterium]
MKKDYVLHLISEISNYILESHPTRMVVSLHQEDDGLHLAVIDDNKRSEEKLEEIRKALNTSVRPEMSEYYGAMGGTDLIGAARLNLLGWQIKRADVYQRDNGTQIDLWIGSDRFDSSQFNIPD